MLSREDIKDEKLRKLYDYWRGKHHNDRLPSRTDIDPVEIPNLLNNIALFRVVGDGEDFVFDLAGAQIEEVHGYSLKGVAISEQRTSLEVTPAVEQYREVAREAEPRYREGDLKPFGKEYWASKRLLLPLSSDGKKVDTVLAGAVFWPARAGRPDT